MCMGVWVYVYVCMCVGVCRCKGTYIPRSTKIFTSAWVGVKLYIILLLFSVVS